MASITAFYPMASAGTRTTRSSQRPKSRRASGMVSSACSLDLGHQPVERARALDRLEAVRVGRDLAPLRRELGRHLQVELQPVRALVREGLVSVGRRAGEQRRAVGEIEGVAVPLEASGSCAGASSNTGSLPASWRQLDRQQAHLGLLAGIDARAERGREQLRAEADAPDRDGRPRPPREARASRRRATGARPPRRRPSARPSRSPPRTRARSGSGSPSSSSTRSSVEPARAQLVLERRRRLARDVLDGEQRRAHARTRSWLYGCGNVAVAPAAHALAVSRPVSVRPVPSSAPRPVSERT